MANYADLDHAALRHTIANHCYSKPGLAIDGTNKENVETTSAIIVSIEGVMYTKAAQTEIDLSALAVITEAGGTTTLTAQATGFDRIYLLVMNAAADLKIIQGTAVATGGDCYCPSCPDSYAAWGAIKIVNTSVGAFTLGTTLMTVTDVVETFYDLAIAPATL